MVNNYTFNDHQKLVLVGIISGIMAAIFIEIWRAWSGSPWYLMIGVPIFVLVIYYIILAPVTYLMFRKLS